MTYHWTLWIFGNHGRDDISQCRYYGKSVLHIAVSLEFWNSLIRGLIERGTYHCLGVMERVWYITLCRSPLDFRNSRNYGNYRKSVRYIFVSRSLCLFPWTMGVLGIKREIALCRSPYQLRPIWCKKHASTWRQLSGPVFTKGPHPRYKWISPLHDE